jgi:hypothetical protein
VSGLAGVCGVSPVCGHVWQAHRDTVLSGEDSRIERWAYKRGKEREASGVPPPTAESEEG